MTKWLVQNPGLEERETDFTASFSCFNGATGDEVTVTVGQQKGKPASDLIGALLATAELLRRAAGGDALESAPLN